MRINVLTYCTGYPFEIYQRFVGSLFDTGFSGILYMVVSPNDVKHLQILRPIYPNLFFFVDSSVPSIHINCHRFFVYKHLFETFNFYTDFIFLCDSRDVLFQKNMEDYPLDETVDLYAFQEGVEIKNEPLFNIPWLQALEYYLNEPILSEIQEQKVICCGTTLAKVNVMKTYINKMCSIIEENNIKLNLDQGIHNYLLYLNKLSLRIQFMTNSDHLVNTVACDAHLLNDQDQIVSSDGKVSYVVHQYDRFSEELKKRISKKYNFNL